MPPLTGDQSALERFAQIGSFRTRYLEAGEPSSPPLILLHDGAWGGCSSVTWGAVLSQLAEDYWVLAPDMQGFGGTDKVVFVDRAPYAPRVRHITEFIETVVGTASVHIAGTSFGGTVALRMLAGGHGVPFRSVTSIGGSGGPWRSRRALEEIGHWDGTRADMVRIVSHLIDPGPAFDAHVDDRLAWASIPGHFRAVMAMSSPVPEALAGPKPRDDWPKALADATSPVLLVAGERDGLLEPDWTDHLVGAMPHAQVSRLDTSHEPSIDAPEKLLPVWRAFMRDADAARAVRPGGE